MSSIDDYETLINIDNRELERASGMAKKVSWKNFGMHACMGIYELALDQITTQVLLEQGCKEDDITRRDKISLSRQLKRIFESNLGFDIRIGRARKRIVRVPQYWVKDSEDLTTYCDDIGASYTHSLSSPDSPQGGD